MKRDLNTYVYYKGKPIQVGKVKGRMVYCLGDLMKALGVKTVHVSHTTDKVPKEHHCRVQSITSGNGVTIGVTIQGATVALIRQNKVDLGEVLEFLEWLSKVDVD